MPTATTVLRCPITRVDEAGGAKHGNFRPGHVVGVIADRSTVQLVTAVATEATEPMGVQILLYRKRR